MDDIEIAAGTAMTAYDFALTAYRKCQEDQQSRVDGSRQKICANVNAPKLHEAALLIEKAIRLLLDARDRKIRMSDT